MLYTLKELQDFKCSVYTEINGKWVPARPVNWKYRSIPEKIKEALAVFTGKADAFVWPEGQ